MKKIFLMLCVAAALSACNSSETDNNTASTRDSTDTTTNTIMATTPYTPAEGDVTFRNDKLMIYRDNAWVETDKDQTVGNGIVVHTNGAVSNGKQTDTLTDGQVVSKTGTFFDRSGNAIKDAWSATKQGVGEAGEAVGHAVGKTAKSAKDEVTGDKK